MFKYNFMIVVKDGANKDIMDEIVGVIDMMTNRRYGKTIGRSVDNYATDTKVIIVRTAVNTFYAIREIIESRYPGICSFEHV